MKIRTDFVTNSSSSSFIFDNTLDIKRVKKELKIVPDECYNEAYEIAWLQEHARYILDHVETVKEFCETNSLYNIMEVVCWYDFQEPTDKEQVKRFHLAKLLLECADRYDFPDNIQNVGIVKVLDSVLDGSEHFLYTYVWEYGAEHGFDNVVMELREYAKELETAENWLCACVKEIVGDGYIFFDESETHYLISDAIKEAAKDSLKYNCNHMG